MDNLVAWIKNNQAKAAAIGVLLAALAYTQLSKPRTYEDCVLQVVKDAKSDDSAVIGRRACRAKFPVEKSSGGRFGGIPVCSETQIYDPFKQTCNNLPKGLSKVPPKN
ncbi:hypothetical protein N9301_04145 [Paracoccaceae bacterium]|nr:hypothetical protein [Paracoccaceae bacterium]